MGSSVLRAGQAPLTRRQPTIRSVGTAATNRHGQSTEQSRTRLIRGPWTSGQLRRCPSGGLRVDSTTSHSTAAARKGRGGGCTLSRPAPDVLYAVCRVKRASSRRWARLSHPCARAYTSEAASPQKSACGPAVHLGGSDVSTDIQRIGGLALAPPHLAPQKHSRKPPCQLSPEGRVKLSEDTAASECAFWPAWSRTVEGSYEVAREEELGVLALAPTRG